MIPSPLPNDRNPTIIIRKKLIFNEHGLCTNAFRVATDPFLLELAYETLKSKPGNMVPGTDPQTLDGIEPS